MRRLICGSVLLLLGLAPAYAAAPDAGRACDEAADTWLLGQWSMTKQLLTISRDGDRLVWRYEREPGLISPRWGLKATATAEGVVAAIRGCEIELRGRYTQYGGTPKALGSAMDYALRFDGLTLAGSGLGWGKERFVVAWRRAP